MKKIYNIITFGKRFENLARAIELDLIGSNLKTFKDNVSENSSIFLHCNGQIWGRAKPIGDYFSDNSIVWDNSIYPHRYKIKISFLTKDPLQMAEANINSEFRSRFGVGWAYKFIFSPKPIPEDIAATVEQCLLKRVPCSKSEAIDLLRKSLVEK